jgi:hypothetical protein
MTQSMPQRVAFLDGAAAMGIRVNDEPFLTVEYVLPELSGIAVRSFMQNAWALALTQGYAIRFVPAPLRGLRDGPRQ